jgi:macrolide-specific efflux system membrane fusion protein
MDEAPAAQVGAKAPRRRRTAIIIAVLIVIGIVALVIGFIGRPTAAASGASLTAQAQLGEVEVSVSASGPLVYEAVYAIGPETDPVIVEEAGAATGTGIASRGYTTSAVDVAPGDTVAAGETVATVTDADDESVSVTTPVAGTVLTVPARAGTDAATVATVGAGETVVSLQISEYDVTDLAVDQEVELELLATGDTFAGSVRSVSPTAQDVEGIQRYTVLISSDELPEDARPGMTVSATIIVDAVTDVITVPSAAVTTLGDLSTVQVVTGDGATELRTVEVGLEGNSTVEITSGLDAGEEVVVGTDGEIPSDTGVPFGPGGFGAP